MFAERLEAILESWKKSFGQYGRQRAQAEQAVVRWEWTTGERYSDLPFHFERFPGRGRVVFCACFKLNGYTPRYGRKRKDPDGLYQWLDYNGRFKTAEEYIYAENRVSIISGYYEVPGISPYTTHEQFAYDEAGNLQRIDRIFQDGQKQVVYRKRPKGKSLQEIQKETTQQLVKAIIQRLKAENIQEKIYCIELYYQKAIQNFPPYIIVVPESYRLKRIQSGDPNARYEIFSPIIEDEWFFEIDDPKTLEMCQILDQEIRAGEQWDTATSILRDVAARLTRQDWSSILNITQDFVVFALDPEMEGDHIVEILSSSASKEQIQDWKDKGWLV